MQNRNLIMAAASGLGWDQISVWALSVRTLNHGGPVVVILYEPNADLQKRLQDLGFAVVIMKTEGSIYNKRFEDFAKVLNQNEGQFDRVVITDIRDVYFQTNPFDWMDANLSKSFAAVTEGIAYRNENWNLVNLIQGFPDHADRLMNRIVQNVGILAGEARTVADVCLAISFMTKASGFRVSDQSGFNMLLSMEPYRSSAQWVKSEDGFCCQVGTFADPAKIATFRPHLVEPEPKVVDGQIVTASGKPYALVHQYDRNAGFADAVVATLNARIRTYG